MNFHGGAESKAYIDFSVNIPPFALPVAYTDMLMDSMAELIHYPEIDGQTSKMALAEHFKFSPKHFLIGNGATELIYLVARAYRDKKVLLIEPTFTEYRRAFESMGNEVYAYFLEEDGNYALNVQKLIAFINTQNIDTLLFCNPNNPTGTLIDVGDMGRLLNETQATLIVDESFLDFIEADKKRTYDTFWEETISTNRVIALRSLTKNYCIPGIRIAYAMAGEGLIQTLSSFKEPWSVNTFALKSLPFLLKNKNHLEQIVKWAHEERLFMYDALKNISRISVVKGEANFFLIRCHVPDFLERLHEKGYHIRTCLDFKGLDASYYRLTLRTRPENQGLIEAIRKVVDANGTD